MSNLSMGDLEKEELLPTDERQDPVLVKPWTAWPCRRWRLWACIVQLFLIILYSLASFMVIRNSTTCSSTPDVQGMASFLSTSINYH
jgi:hypothetical protein